MIVAPTAIVPPSAPSAAGSAAKVERAYASTGRSAALATGNALIVTTVIARAGERRVTAATAQTESTVIGRVKQIAPRANSAAMPPVAGRKGARAWAKAASAAMLKAALT